MESHRRRDCDLSHISSLVGCLDFFMVWSAFNLAVGGFYIVRLSYRSHGISHSAYFENVAYFDIKDIFAYFGKFFPSGSRRIVGSVAIWHFKSRIGISFRAEHVVGNRDRICRCNFYRCDCI